MGEIQSLSFLSPGNFPDADPYRGLEDTLRLFEYGERLGFDGAWIRQRHLEHGVSSGAVFLAAAAQRTSRVELGTAVIPMGYESPFRLAEDLSTADVLSRGRLQVGVSTGMPHPELMAGLVFDGDWQGYDFSHARIEKLIRHLGSEYLGDPETRIVSPGNVQRPRLQPHSAGLADRVWYGGTSWRSVRWSARAGVNLLSGNILAGEGATGFSAHQVSLLREYRSRLGAGRQGRIAIGRVIVPLDGADRATRQRYLAYAAGRHERTLRPQGPRGTLFATDLVGPADEIAERLLADAAVQEVSELRMELPYEFGHQDYEQLLHDTARLIAPRLGWTPAGQPPPPAASASAGTAEAPTAPARQA
jgi:alkanesulfonate monooxygenase SsuD/methylene tetrahydromethanopterin reductase-like flavin-dependent oxidoreductase (luciferase family)